MNRSQSQQMRVLMAASAAVMAGAAAFARAQSWNSPAGGTWNDAGNWTPNTIPNSVGAAVDVSVTPPGGSDNDITLDGDFTAGSIVFTINAPANDDHGLSNGTSTIGLTLDNGGAGATITTQGTGTANLDLDATLVLADDVTANVNHTTNSSAAGSLNLTGVISGSGSFTKNGDGVMTWGTNPKDHTGATILNGGRTRMSTTGAPTANSSFTINAGAQLELISDGTYTFGPGPLNLNGSGTVSGPHAIFPGAIRPQTNDASTITNDVVLQSNTLIHVEGASTGSITLTGSVSGPGQLRLTAPNSSNNQGRLVLGSTNSYAGGTYVAGGLLLVNAAGGLGSGDVQVNNADTLASIARLQLAADDAIADSAALILAGGGTGGLADLNFAILDAGVDDTIGALVLGGISETGIGTYGATGSGADFIRDDFFAGSGVVRLVPEPGSLAILGLIGIGLTGRRRNRCGN